MDGINLPSLRLKSFDISRHLNEIKTKINLQNKLGDGLQAITGHSIENPRMKTS